MDFSDILESSDEEEATSGVVLHLLTLAWLNEKFCPELLKHETALVNCMMDQIKQMEKNLENVSHDDFRLVPHRMEVDRIRYVLSSYLRARLEKIESFTAHLIRLDSENPNEDEKLMSKGEFAFAKSFLKSLQDYFHDEAEKYLPSLLREKEGANSAIEVVPNLNCTVFIRMVKTVRSILICDQVVDLTAGSRHLLPYKDVRHLIIDGSAFLI